MTMRPIKGAGLVLVMLAAAALVTAMASAASCQDKPGGSAGKETTVERGLREAKALGRAGNFDAAIQKLEALYSSYPNDPEIMTALSSALVQVKRYDRAEVVMEKSIELRPMDPKSLTDLASLYLIIGRRDAAVATLERLVALDPEERWPYQAASSSLWRGGAAAEALAMIMRGKKAVGDSTLLASEAAQILKSQGRFADAVREYLRAGAAGHDPEIAAAGIVEMAQDAAARKTIITALTDAAAAADYEVAARTSLSHVYLLEGDCRRAVAEISALAKAKRLSPLVLSRFAARSRAAGCTGECAEVYDIALALPENKADYPVLLLSKGGCEVAAGSLEQAAATYDDVAKRYPDSRWACDAEVALAKLLRGQGRFPEAVAHADRAIGAKSAGDTKYEAILFKGDCLVAAGNLDDAFAAYDQVGTDWKPVYAQEAFYNLGEIRLYQDSLQEAISYYNVTLREYPMEARANDAIERLLLLKSVKGDLGTMWLKEFAHASLLRRQGQIDEAAALFTKRAGETGQGQIKIESLKNLALIDLDRGNPDAAISIYKAIGESLDTYFSPSALEAIGDIYARLGKAEMATRAFEEVILKFPDSVSAGEARRKIDLVKRQGASEPK
jgi:tetratricopeptide (TPR) repeat protein